jgi:hypothetical protein
MNAEVDNFGPKVVQAGVKKIIEVTYKPITTIRQIDLEFTIAAQRFLHRPQHTHRVSTITFS